MASTTQVWTISMAPETTQTTATTSIKPDNGDCLDGYYIAESQLKSIMHAPHWFFWPTNSSLSGLACTPEEKRIEHQGVSYARSAPFNLTEHTVIKTITQGGSGIQSKVQSGFMGVALEDDEDGSYLTPVSRNSNSNEEEVLTIKGSDYPSFLGKKVRLNFIDAASGEWGWITFKNLAIWGTCQEACVSGFFTNDKEMRDAMTTSIGDSWEWWSEPDGLAAGRWKTRNSNHPAALLRSVTFKVTELLAINVLTDGQKKPF